MAISLKDQKSQSSPPLPETSSFCNNFPVTISVMSWVVQIIHLSPTSNKNTCNAKFLAQIWWIWNTFWRKNRQNAKAQKNIFEKNDFQVVQGLKRKHHESWHLKPSLPTLFGRTFRHVFFFLRPPKKTSPKMFSSKETSSKTSKRSSATHTSTFQRTQNINRSRNIYMMP